MTDRLLRRTLASGAAAYDQGNGIARVLATDVLEARDPSAVFNLIAAAEHHSIWSRGLELDGSTARFSVTEVEPTHAVSAQLATPTTAYPVRIEVFGVHNATLLSIRQDGVAVEAVEAHQAFWSDQFVRALRLYSREKGNQVEQLTILS